MTMYLVRANVGIQQHRRGDEFRLTPEKYDKLKAFVTVIEAPEPTAKPEPEPEKPKKEKNSYGMLRRESSPTIDADEPDHVGSTDDDGESEEDSSDEDGEWD